MQPTDVRPSGAVHMADQAFKAVNLAVVIPCYKVKDHVLQVIAGLGPEVKTIYAVDDGCPEGSGRFIEERCRDPRVVVLFNPENLGVGGAVVTGYKAAMTAGADVIVKVDGDGQMDPRLVPMIAWPVVSGVADYAKGNRFHSIYDVRTMPPIRLFGNAVLSFMTKASSGYWSIFDPTNGFTAVHSEALHRISLDGLAKRYFFESDLLIQLGGIRAVVRDVPMQAVYGDEKSNLRISEVVWPFLKKHVHGLARRLIYGYFLRDFSVASLQLLLGLPSVLFGLVFGVVRWVESASAGVAASTGTVMLATLPVILGVQFLLAFIGADIAREPHEPLQPYLQFRRWKWLRDKGA